MITKRAVGTMGGLANGAARRARGWRDGNMRLSPVEGQAYEV